MNVVDNISSTDWFPSTPMTLDIDYATARYGAATTTRTGDDTYGFNAHFSGPVRSAFDFSINKTPLVTIFDNGGNDTLNASGFRDDEGDSRSVHVDLNRGAESYLIDDKQVFAVIYKTTDIETLSGAAAMTSFSAMRFRTRYGAVTATIPSTAAAAATRCTAARATTITSWTMWATGYWKIPAMREGCTTRSIPI